ncbi:MAG: lipoyl(octanoyl) transferase LipB [Terracidiphilus sp.]
MIQYLYLGRVSYEGGLRLQAELVDLRLQGRVDNVLALLEHPPVLTLGRNANRSNILASDELLANRGINLHEINRGGDITYHGPGQLVGYPIFDLRSLRNPSSASRLGAVDFVRLMEEALIRLCAVHGILAGRICGLTGVWCPPIGTSSMENCASMDKDHPHGERKIGAIGIHVSRGITSHGFAFNVTTDLRDFALINPCGITNRPITSLKNEIEARQGSLSSTSAIEALPGLEDIAHQAARQFGIVFNQQILAVESLAALRVQAAAATPPASSTPDFPANDTPLRVPAEVERLAHVKDRSIRT